MVNITIVGNSSASPHHVLSYEDECDTITVKADLFQAFGRGHLQRNGMGVVSKTLTGDYDYLITDPPQYLHPTPPEDIQDDICRRLERIEAKENIRTSIISNTLTRAELVVHLRSEGVLAHSEELDTFLDDHKVQWWPITTKHRFPKLGNPARSFCQMFVTAMLSKLAAQTVEVHLEEGTQKKGVKKVMQVEIRSLPDPEAFRRTSIHHRYPDAVFYDGKTRGEAAITMLGEVKGVKGGEFPDEDIGKLVRDLMRLLHRQLFRSTLIGVLTDGYRFMFVRGVRQRDGDLQFETSRVFKGTGGWQRLFGLMVADPAEIGFMPLVLPGYTVDSLLGKGAFATVYKAIQTDASASSPPTETVETRPRHLPASLAVHRVLGDGNCFFHAIADQLQRLGVRDACGYQFTLESLSELTLSLVTTEPHLRALLIEADVLDLARLNGYVDRGAVAAMAVAIHQDIVLYHPTGVLRFDTSRHTHVGHRDNASTPAVRVMYNGHDRYDSVVPATGGASSSIQLPREAAETDADATSPRKKAKTEPRVVVVKVYPQDYYTMRDNEMDTLCSLAPHRHVPVVVDGCDINGKPALLVTPVGRPVWPVTGGVRAWVPDYLKLLAVLQHAHRQGICHRDVKPQNIFIDDRGDVFLNDWGSAAMTGELTAWAGTAYFYTPQDEHWPSPAEDLVAFVLTIFVLNTGVAPSEARRCIACSAFWQEALRLANLCDYDALRNHINSR